jgi:hypothetical protein
VAGEAEEDRHQHAADHQGVQEDRDAGAQAEEFRQ